MEDRIATKLTPNQTVEKPKKLSKYRQQYPKHINIFIRKFKEELRPNSLAPKNCVLRAIVVSVWPPYGLALSKEHKYLELGIILFHQCRIIEDPELNKSSSKIKFHSKGISRYGIYSKKCTWIKSFDVGCEIMIRISEPLNECSNRWKTVNGNDIDNNNIKLSDFIQYKAVKLWTNKHSATGQLFKGEPRLEKPAKCDQMKQFYYQWSVNEVFCLQQLLGVTTRKLVTGVINGTLRLNTECANMAKSEVALEDDTDNMCKGTITLMPNSKKTQRPISSEVDCANVMAPHNFHSDSPIWSELEPVCDNDDIEQGILCLENS